MMAFVVLVAFLNGALNIINKMVNLRAKQVLGMANGTLINYLEASALAFALSLLLGERHLLQPVYLGGVLGLVAMVLSIWGMEKVAVAVSAMVVLAGQLLASFVMDFLAGRVGLRELLGLCLVYAGVWWIGAGKTQPEEAPAEETQTAEAQSRQ